MKNISDNIFRHYRVKRSLEFLNQYNEDSSWQQLSRKIKIRQLRGVITKVSSVAALFIFVIGTSYILLRNTGSTIKVSPQIANSNNRNTFTETGGKKATLVLDNGDKINLGEDNMVISDHSTGVIVNNQKYSQLSYKAAESQISVSSPTHTLIVPKGGEYKLKLSDGTEIIMNSESSLYYPIQFTDQCRKVKLSGEAYFKVAKLDKRPFVVEMESCSVTVLGTSFNISAYPHRAVYATLVEGKISVKNQTDSAILLPNRQAIIAPEGAIEVESVNSTHFTSWIDGVYQFKDTRLEEVLDQLSRWYSVNIEFADPQIRNKRFTGVILREEKLSFAVEILEKVSDIQFFREGENIKVYRKHKNKP